MRKLVIAASAGLLALGLGGAASADTVIKFSDSKSPTPNELAIKSGKVLIKPPKGGGRIIVDTGAGKMVMINDQQKQYMEMTEQTIDQSTQLMNQVRQQMMAQLKNLPPEQRKLMEQRMGINQPAPKLPKVAVQPTGQKKKVSGVECEVNVITTDGQKTAEVCIASPQAAGMDKADYETLHRMFEFSRKMAAKSARAMGAAASQLPASQAIPDINGLPMEVRDLKSGNVVTITAIEKKPLNAADFAPGAGYRKFDMIGQMRQQMQQLQQQRQPAR